MLLVNCLKHQQSSYKHGLYAYKMATCGPTYHTIDHAFFCSITVHAMAVKEYVHH